MTLNDPRLIRTGPTSGSVRLQRAELPTWPVMPPPIPIGAIWIFMGLAVAAGCVLIRWYARTLFDIDHRIDTDGGGSGTWLPAQGLVLLHPTGALRDTLDELVLQGPVGPAGPQRPACWIDLQESRSGWSADDWCGLVVVDHLEHGLDDSDFNRAKLALLERLVLRQKLHVVVLSKIDPLRYFCDRLQSPGNEKADERYVTSEEIDRWAAIMERLLKVAAPLGGLSEDGQQRIDEWIPGAFTAVKEWEDAVDAAFQKYAESKQYGLEEGDAFEKWRRALKEECRWTPHLRGIAVEAAALLDAPDDPMDRVGDLARAHYRTVWSTLTDQQRLVLIHLARNGFANPNPQNWPVVRHLAEQGLIRRTPALRLMNETFECFVKQVETEEQVSKWERAAGPSTWSRIRSVVVVASILIAVFLFQTQPQLLTYIAGGLAAAAGLAATVSNLLGFFQGRRVPSPPPQGSAPS